MQAVRLTGQGMAKQAYIGLGSNLQDPENQIRRALLTMQGLPGVELLKSSSLYQSQPMGPSEQPDFVNAVAKVSTVLDPAGLLTVLQRIEHLHQRVRKSQRWGPRTLDLDILLYGDLEIDTKRLRIPHPGMSEREFVLIPLQEIEKDLIIPGQGSLSEMIEKLPCYRLKKIATPYVGP